jgi:hypothetical protein
MPNRGGIAHEKYYDLAQFILLLPPTCVRSHPSTVEFCLAAELALLPVVPKRNYAQEGNIEMACGVAVLRMTDDLRHSDLFTGGAD